MDGDKNGKKIINVELDDSDTNDSNSENSTFQSEGSNSNINSKKYNKKNSKALTEVLLNDNMKFLNNFDPEQSNRERRKLTRKINAETGKKTGSVYDENGILSGSDKDICDCLAEECPGCHFPCPKCRSCKCGVDCRINRKWTYEAIENEGETTMPKNTHGLSNSYGSQSTGSG